MKFEVSKLAELIGIIGAKNLEDSVIALDGSRASELYEYIKYGEELTDEAVKAFLYGDAQNGETNLHHLKSRLGAKLIDSLIILPNKQNSIYKTNFNECYKNFVAIKLLISKGARQSAIGIAEETLKKTKRYDLTELTYLISFELMRHYALVGEGKKSNVYRRMYESYFEVHRVELALISEFAQLSALFAKTKKWTKSDYRTISEYLEKIEECATQASSFSIIFYRNLASILCAQLYNDYKKIVEVGQRAINELDELSFQASNIFYFSFLYYLIPALIVSRQFERANSIIIRCLEMTTREGYNRNITLLYQTVYGFYSADYALAESSYQTAMKYKKEIPANIMEQWKIIEAHLYLLRATGHLEKSKSRFRIHKFLNEVPAYSKDKTGANVSIIVVQILLLLARKERGHVIDRMDALRMYAHKYLRKDNTFRSQCFIKILLQLERSYFNPIAFKRKTADLFERLKAAPTSLTDLEVELIPYEKQYELILELLS